MLGRVFEASSIILLRSTPKAAQYELLMVGRPVTATSFAERVVFPGGKVEKADSVLKRSNSKAAKPFTNRYQVCAIRELFEETGVLLAEPSQNLSNEESVHWRRRVLTDANSFNDMMETYQCEANVNGLHAWSHWITPASGEHRFDTWFFVAKAPADAKASVFPGEMELTDISWRSPRQALEAYRKRQLQLAPPQIYTLEQLSSLSTIDDVFKHIPKPQNIKEYLPMIEKKEEGVFTVLLPGDKDYKLHRKGETTNLHRVEVHSDPELTKVYGAH